MSSPNWQYISHGFVTIAKSPMRTACTDTVSTGWSLNRSCNRLEAMARELGKTGIRAEEKEDGLVIEGGSPRGADIDTYDDHRIAMSFAILGLAVPGMRIRDGSCVRKSFPGFWNELGKLYGDRS